MLQCTQVSFFFFLEGILVLQIGFEQCNSKGWRGLGRAGRALLLCCGCLSSGWAFCTFQLCPGVTPCYSHVSFSSWELPGLVVKVRVLAFTSKKRKTASWPVGRAHGDSPPVPGLLAVRVAEKPAPTPFCTCSPAGCAAGTRASTAPRQPF